MNDRQFYMKKRKEVHTPEEFLAAFEDNTAIVFRKNKYKGLVQYENIQS